MNFPTDEPKTVLGERQGENKSKYNTVSMSSFQIVPKSGRSTFRLAANFCAKLGHLVINASESMVISLFLTASMKSNKICKRSKQFLAIMFSSLENATIHKIPTSSGRTNKYGKFSMRSVSLLSKIFKR